MRSAHALRTRVLVAHEGPRVVRYHSGRCECGGWATVAQTTRKKDVLDGYANHVAGLIEGEQLSLFDELDVSCGRCGALADEPCRTSSGTHARGSHKARKVVT